MVGSIIAPWEPIIADCCVSVLVEISNPIDKAVMMNKALSKKRSKIFPFIGKPSTNTLNTNIMTTFTIEIMKYGTALDKMI